MWILEWLAQRIDRPTTVAVNHPDHLVELVEHHEMSVVIPPGDLDPAARAAVWSVCRQAVREWAVEAGLAVTATVDFDDRTSEGRTVGCRFTVMVGRGAAAPAGTSFSWLWSARWRDWLRLFTQMAGPDELLAARQSRAVREELTLEERLYSPPGS